MQKKLNILDFERSLAELDKNIALYENAANMRGTEKATVLAELRGNRERLIAEIYLNIAPDDEVYLARHKDRPYSLDYIQSIFDDFVEMHGDRLHSDDQAIVGGPARLRGRAVMIVAQQKGRDLAERKKRNFGYAGPDGYRKALRLMKLAEKLHLPVITLIDTPGADPNVDSEERGISEAIARNLMEMSVLATPIICAIIGEGGSGGALGLAVADRVLMLEHSIYSVIAPEGCAAIMETFGRDPSRWPEAAEALNITSKAVRKLGLCDSILTEPVQGAHKDPVASAKTLGDALCQNVDSLSTLAIDVLLQRRYAKFRSMGVFDQVPG
jgi:acetyl-CoA carboxylase carboxyl transferase subunit alpha